jgi:hypothetical protein
LPNIAIHELIAKRLENEYAAVVRDYKVMLVTNPKDPTKGLDIPYDEAVFPPVLDVVVCFLFVINLMYLKESMDVEPLPVQGESCEVKLEEQKADDGSVTERISETTESVPFVAEVDHAQIDVVPPEAPTEAATPEVKPENAASTDKPDNNPAPKVVHEITFTISLVFADYPSTMLSSKKVLLVPLRVLTLLDTRRRW